MPNQTSKTAASPPDKEKKQGARRDQLHVSYSRTADGTGFADVVAFGTRPEALEHAIEHEQKVATLTKGQSLRDALGGSQS